jgi:hypothetical protein
MVLQIAQQLSKLQYGIIESYSRLSIIFGVFIAITAILILREKIIEENLALEKKTRQKNHLNKLTKSLAYSN